MRRPLFCVAMAYALGEVVCLYTSSAVERSIATVMLLCCGVFFVKKTKKWKCALFALLAFFAGIWRAFFGVPADIRMHVNAESGFLAAEEEHYEISVYGGVVADGEENADEKGNITGGENKAGIENATGGETLYGEGDVTGKATVVSGMITGIQGEHPIVQVCESTSKRLRKGDYIVVYGTDASIQESLAIGSCVNISGEVSLFEFATNPGGFCARTYYQARKISAYMYAEELQITPDNCESLKGCYYRLKRHLYDIRISIKQVFYRTLPEDVASLYTGILLGDKSGIEQDVRRQYQLGGIAHILAISGVNTLSLAYIIICKTAILRHF